MISKTRAIRCTCHIQRCTCFTSNIYRHRRIFIKTFSYYSNFLRIKPSSYNNINITCFLWILFHFWNTIFQSSWHETCKPHKCSSCEVKLPLISFSETKTEKKMQSHFFNSRFISNQDLRTYFSNNSFR